MKKISTQLLVNFVLRRILEKLWRIASKLCSVQFSDSVVTPWITQHVRPPCPSPTPRNYSTSCPLSRWCHPTISSSCFQSFPAAESFPISNESAVCIRSPKYWSLSFSISVPMNTQDWFPLGLTGLIPLWSKGLSRVFSNTTVQKHCSS